MSEEKWNLVMGAVMVGLLATGLVRLIISQVRNRNWPTLVALLFIVATIGGVVLVIRSGVLTGYAGRLRANYHVTDCLTEIIWLPVMIWAGTFVVGWLLLLLIMLLQYLIPSRQDSLEAFLQRTAKPLGLAQRYSGWAIVIILVTALLSWLTLSAIQWILGML